MLAHIGANRLLSLEFYSYRFIIIFITFYDARISTLTRFNVTRLNRVNVIDFTMRICSSTFW